jgi:hypothetical protein
LQIHPKTCFLNSLSTFMTASTIVGVGEGVRPNLT